MNYCLLLIRNLLHVHNPIFPPPPPPPIFDLKTSNFRFTTSPSATTDPKSTSNSNNSILPSRRRLTFKENGNAEVNSNSETNQKISDTKLTCHSSVKSVDTLEAAASDSNMPTSKATKTTPDQTSEENLKETLEISSKLSSDFEIVSTSHVNESKSEENISNISNLPTEDDVNKENGGGDNSIEGEEDDGDADLPDKMKKSKHFIFKTPVSLPVRPKSSKVTGTYIKGILNIENLETITKELSNNDTKNTKESLTDKDKDETKSKEKKDDSTENKNQDSNSTENKNQDSNSTENKNQDSNSSENKKSKVAASKATKVRKVSKYNFL